MKRRYLQVPADCAWYCAEGAPIGVERNDQEADSDDPMFRAGWTVARVSDGSPAGNTNQYERIATFEKACARADVLNDREAQP